MTQNELPTWNAAHEVAQSVLGLGVTLGGLSFNGCSAWMVNRLTDRFADVIHQHGRPTRGAHYIVPLGNATPEPGSREDRTCDRCGHFVPYGASDGEFYVLRIALLENVTVCGGLCTPCMALEDVQGGVSGCA